MPAPMKRAGTTASRPRVGGGRAAAAQPAFQYKARTAEQVRERATRSIGGKDSYFNSEVQYFTPRAGENTVRILPPPPESDWGHYGFDVTVHYGIGADSSPYLCLDKMKGEPCPLCEARQVAASNGEEELAQELKPGSRVAVFVIDRSQEGKGPLLWNMPAGLDKDIVKLAVDPKTQEVLAVDDPNDGYDLTFTREGEGLKTKYKGIQFDRKSSPLSDDAETGEGWLQWVTEHPIDQCLEFKDYDYIAKVFEGQPPPETEGEPEPPARGGRGKPAAAAPAAPARVALRRGAAPPPEEPPPEDVTELEWEDLQQLDADGLSQLGDDQKLEWPREEFDSEDALREFVADRLGVKRPAPARAAGSGSAGLKAKLAAMKKK